MATTRTPNRWGALAVLAASLVVVTIDNTVLNTALPTLARALHASTTDLQWISDAYTLVFASMLILAGGIAQRVGLRRAMVAGLALFAAGSLASGFVHTSGALIALRAVMGFGAAFVMPATLASIMRLFDARERATAISIWSASAGLGVAIGPVLGGVLLVHFFWGSVFWINVPLVALAVVAQLLFVPDFEGIAVGRLDGVGALVSTLGVAALVDAVIEGPTRGWLTGTTWGELAAAAVLLAGFVAWELRTANPMVDVRVFARRRFAAAATALAVTFFVLFGTLFELTQYLQMVHGFDPLRAGLGALPFAGAMMVTAGTSRLVSARLGANGSIALGLATMGGGLAALSTVSTATPFFVVAVLMGVIGAGMGLVMAPASETSVASVPLDQGAAASSLNSVTREMGGVLGIAAIGSITENLYRTHLAPTLTGLGARTHPLLGLASQGIATAHVVSHHLPARAALGLVRAANAGFTSAMDVAVRAASAVAIVGAVVTWLALRGEPDVDRPTATMPEVPALATLD